jgi:hypothetical protein
MSSAKYASNDNTVLEPRTSFDGPNLTFDFPALQIGFADSHEQRRGYTLCSHDQ